MTENAQRAHLAPRVAPRVAIVTNGNYFANLALGTLLTSTSDEIDYRVVITSGLRKQSGNRLGEVSALFQRWGARYSAYKVSTVLLPKLLAMTPSVGISRDHPSAPLLQRRATTVAATCRRLGIPVLPVRNVNQDPGASWLAGFRPDLLLSFSCPYRIGSDLLELPTIGSLNVHGSMLPSYAGVCTYVHVLADGCSATGVTVHEMVERFDAGRVAAQAEVPIEPGTSVFALFSAQCRTAGDLLVDCIRDCTETGKIPGHLQDESKRTYFGEPTRGDIKRLRANGHRLLRLRDLARMTHGVT
jgi:methionyl-tRNA formyltransferase